MRVTDLRGGVMGSSAIHTSRLRSRPTAVRGRLALAVATVAAAFLIAPSAALAAAGVPGTHRWAEPISTGVGNGYDEATAVATNSAGDAIVVGDNGRLVSDITYRSYSPDGTPRWAATWDGSGGNDRVAGVVVDKARNCVYVAGTTESPDGDTDYVLLKLRDSADGSGPAGGLIWAQTFDASPGGDEYAAAIARDKYGDIYITGASQRTDDSWDLHLVKYGPDGTLAWARRHNNGSTRRDWGRTVAVRGERLFVAGESNRRYGGADHDDLVLLRYSLGGSKKWVRYYNGPTRYHPEEVTAMALTSSSVYLCGKGKSAKSRSWDGFSEGMLLKYGHDGSKKWVRYTAGSGNNEDSWNDLAVDNRARVHVTGTFVRKYSGTDIVTRLYNSSGKRLWQRILKTGRADHGLALAVDSARRTYVCGYRTLNSDEDAIVIKYGTGGATLWKTTYPDPARYPGESDAGDDLANDVAVAGENVYVAGRQIVDHGGSVDADFLSLAIWR